jgi:hypothetical protein
MQTTDVDMLRLYQWFSNSCQQRFHDRHHFFGFSTVITNSAAKLFLLNTMGMGTIGRKPFGYSAVEVRA